MKEMNFSLQLENWKIYTYKDAFCLSVYIAKCCWCFITKKEGEGEGEGGDG